MSRKLKQIKFPEDLWVGLRDQADARGLNLKEHCQKALRWFIQHRTAGEERSGMMYLASPEAGAYRSLWLDPDVYDEVRSLAHSDGVSQNRVVYTALCLYWNMQLNTRTVFSPALCIAEPPRPGLKSH